MTRSLITTLSQRLAIAEVKDIEVTGIVEDSSGGWVRSLRFYGTPATGTARLLVLDVLLQAASRADLAITTPEIDF